MGVVGQPSRGGPESVTKEFHLYRVLPDSSLCGAQRLAPTVLLNSAAGTEVVAAVALVEEALDAVQVVGPSPALRPFGRRPDLMRSSAHSHSFPLAAGSCPSLSLTTFRPASATKWPAVSRSAEPQRVCSDPHIARRPCGSAGSGSRRNVHRDWMGCSAACVSHVDVRIPSANRRRRMVRSEHARRTLCVSVEGRRRTTLRPERCARKLGLRRSTPPRRPKGGVPAPRGLVGQPPALRSVMPRTRTGGNGYRACMGTQPSAGLPLGRRRSLQRALPSGSTPIWRGSMRTPTRRAGFSPKLCHDMLG